MVEPPRPRTAALALGVRGVVVRTLVDPVRTGRIRDVGWPYGLRAVVLVAYLVFALAGILVAVAGRLRRGARLDLGASSNVLLPEPGVWMLVTLFSFGLALLLCAGLRAPWWLRLAALLVVLATLSAWSLRTPGTAGWVGWTVTVPVLLLGLVLLVVLRARRAFAWWELVAAWALVGTCLVVGLVENRYAVGIGDDVSPLLLQYLASILGLLVLPTAIVAGVSVAELSVRLTTAATEQAQRLSHRAVPYVLLGVVLVVRGVQVARQAIRLDPVTQGWDTVLPAAVLVVLLTGVGLTLLGVAGRRGSRVVVADLGDELTEVAYPAAVGLILVQLPGQLAVGLVPLVAVVDTAGVVTSSAFDLGAFLARLTEPVRGLVGLALLVLAHRAARRGRATRALVLGLSGVVLVVLARTLITDDQARGSFSVDMLNLLATAVIVVGGLVSLARRRLTGRRALALAGALILCALFSGRDFVSDPVGALLGYSGAALVLFGLTWNLLTGSAWANGSSRRFDRPTRVLLVLASSVLTMSVLAFGALVRDASTTVYLDEYASFGDFVFGTALLAAAVVALLVPSSVAVATVEPGSPNGASLPAPTSAVATR